MSLVKWDPLQLVQTIPENMDMIHREQNIVNLTTLLSLV